MLAFINRLLKNNKGATAIEYVLLAGLISIAAIAAMTSVGTEISGAFTTVKDKLDAASTRMEGANPTPATKQTTGGNT